MHVNIIYAHPDQDSMTYRLLCAFIKGLEEAKHTYEIHDLYAQHFISDMSAAEYQREAFYRKEAILPEDVIQEQKKLENADVLVFVYPVFWSEAPAKLVGWFQRVWTYGFAYGDETLVKTFDKVLFLVSMGGDEEESIHMKQQEAMRFVMLEDRIGTRSKNKDMVFFTKTSRENRLKTRMQEHLRKAYELGKQIDR